MRLLCLVLVLAGNLIATADRPNILWVVSEDNSPEFVGAYGNELARTPHIDRLAAQGIRFEHAYTAPICAPSRSSIITGCFASSLGTQHMRSEQALPADVHFFPEALRAAGYYCTNNSKTDYNTSTPWQQAWDESSPTAHWRNRKPGQPFFAVFNFHESHESRLLERRPLLTKPGLVRVPAYLPDTLAVRTDLARYYDCVSRADAAIGEILAQLEADGLADDTIIFYYSDHGGAVAGSKRFLNEAGTRASMVAYFPAKYARLAPSGPGSVNREVINFIDLAPTVLSLASVAPLPQFQGRAFAGPARAPAPEFTFMFADRMDERYNLVRAVSDGRYRYVRNYHPERPWGQWSDFLWRLTSVQEWDLYQKSLLTNPAQAQFFSSAPAEALYDSDEDPDNVHNLAVDPAQAERVRHMRGALRNHLLSIRDTGFLPEPMMTALAAGQSPRIVASDDTIYPLARIVDWLDAVQLRQGTAPNVDLTSAPAVLRYWLAAADPSAPLPLLLEDPDLSVRVAAAEALLRQGESQPALDTLEAAIRDDAQPWGAVFALDALARVNPALPDSLADRLGTLAALPDWGGTSYFLARLSRHLLTDHRQPTFILNLAQAPTTYAEPYPASEHIAGMELDWTTHQRFAQGSDNFQLTWADDDHLYGAWGDGGGFGGTNSRGRVDLGVARIEGPADSYQGFNVWGGFEAENPATFDGKSWGMIAVDETLYMWTVPGSVQGSGHRKPFAYVELARSLDHGASWTKADWTFRENENLVVPTFLNFGRANSGVPPRMDGYVYAYFIGPETPDYDPRIPGGRGLGVQVPGFIYLSRTPSTDLFDSRDAYEFFAGLDANGQPQWGTVDEKQPVFRDSNGVGWCVSAAYNPTLDRVLLVTEHGLSHHGLLGFFDAPNPWGPWTTISYAQADSYFGLNRPGDTLPWGLNTFFASFPTKWFDGDNFTLTFTGAGRGADNDSFNTVRGRFLRHSASGLTTNDSN